IAAGYAADADRHAGVVPCLVARTERDAVGTGRGGGFIGSPGCVAIAVPQAAEHQRAPARRASVETKSGALVAACGVVPAERIAGLAHGPVAQAKSAAGIAGGSV